MAVGYAVLTQGLNIDGTAKVTGIWDIKFTKVTSTPSGGALNKESVTFNDTTVTFNTTLNEPGDMMTYTITVKNNGNIPAIVDSIILTDSTNSDINYSYNGIAQGNVLEPSATHKFNVVVEYDKSVTNVTKTSESATLTVNYVQKFGSSITETVIVPTVLSVYGIDIPITTFGDGLYADEYEPGRYIFKGKRPSNNITFNGEDWQILSIENDGTLKIIKQDKVLNKEWDLTSNRNGKSGNSYCPGNGTWGCSAWAKTSSIIDTATGTIPTEYKYYSPAGNSSSYTTIHSGSVSLDSTINTYLNENYFNTKLLTDKQYIIEHTFNVSTPGNGNGSENIAADIEQEKMYTWVGKVGLITATEYMRTTTNNKCTSLGSANNLWNGTTFCGTNNWLTNNTDYWTLSPTADNSYVHLVSKVGGLSSTHAHYSLAVRPVVYLDSTITLSGNGTTTSRYQITGRM